MAMAAIMACGTADAQCRHLPRHTHRIATVVMTPAATINAACHRARKERLRMVMAYLKRHSHMTVRQYAKITGLTKGAARTELDALAASKDCPITAAMHGGKKVYTLRSKTRSL